MITEVEESDEQTSVVQISPDDIINAPLSNLIKLDPFDFVTQADPDSVLEFIEFFLNQAEEHSYVIPEESHSGVEDPEFSWDLYHSYIVRMIFRLLQEVDFLAHSPISGAVSDLAVTSVRESDNCKFTRTMTYDHPICKMATSAEVKKGLLWSMFRNSIDFKPGYFTIYTESTIAEVSRFLDFVPETLRSGYQEYIGIIAAKYYSPNVTLQDPRTTS